MKTFYGSNKLKCDTTEKIWNNELNNFWIRINVFLYFCCQLILFRPKYRSPVGIIITYQKFLGK